MQELSITLNTFYKIQIPSTISPRYTDSLYNELDLLKKEGSRTSGASNFTWTFKVNVSTSKRISFFQSPSHQLTLISQNEEGTQTILVMAEASLPNKDFTFLYTTEDFHLPSCALGRTDASSTAMLSFIPKFCTLSISDAYKAEKDHRSFEPDLQGAKGDYVFLLDRSRSMGGRRLEKAKEALVLFLKSLPQDSYFNVISFGWKHQKMFKKSEKYEQNTLEKAIEEIQPMKANLGGTVIYSPLKEVLEEEINKGYPKHIFLLTDGGVSDTESVLHLIKSKTNYCRVHCIGVGNGASFSLIEGSARNGKGKYVMISDEEDPAEKIIELLESTLTPLISELYLHFDEDIVESVVPNPRAIPYILKDDVVNFYVNFKGALDKEASFTFSYQDSLNKLPYTSNIQVRPDSLSQPFVNKMAHLKVVGALEEAARGVNILEDRVLYAKVKDYKKEAIEQSVKHQVLSRYTAFICIGGDLDDGKYQEFIDVRVEKVQINQPKPKQMEVQRRAKRCRRRARKVKILVEELNGASSDSSSDEDIDRSASRSRQKAVAVVKQERQKKNKQSPFTPSTIIEKLIAVQNIDGSWSDITILRDLINDEQPIEEFLKAIKKQVILTYLAVLYIQKYHLQKQYALLIKKAQSWLRKAYEQNSIDEKNLESLVEIL